jgi:uncharacterized protein DUF3309
MLLILLLLVIVFTIGGAPGWGYHQFGYYPSGVGLVLVVLLILLLLGRF